MADRAEPRVIGVDWSGAKTGARRKIWLAEVRAGRVRRLECGRSREQLIRHLVEEASRDPELVVGLDFAFSFPRWFAEERGAASVGALWSRAADDGEEWLRACDPPFWGRPGRGRPAQAGFRRTEIEVRERFGSQPKSVFQIGGAGAVGTMSIRGMPHLRTLRDAGFGVWPFDPAEPPFVVEIYPRLMTGDLVKSDDDARAGHLRGGYPELDERTRAAAAASDDALDAAVSAIAMWRRRDDLLRLEQARDETEALEGRIWYPGVEANELEGESGTGSPSRRRFP